MPGLHNTVQATAVAELLSRYGLDPRLTGRFIAVIELLASDPGAPTTITEPRRVLADHLADSLVALELSEVRDARTVVDLGSGAGFPGLALAIALPAAQFWLVEATQRKCDFIARAVQAGRAANAHVVAARAEELPPMTSEAGFPPPDVDLVTARALAPLAVVAEYAAPLLRIGGTLLVWRGRRNEAEESAAARAAPEIGLRVREIHRVTPYPGAVARHLHALSKVAMTPERFPRRPGIALKRPLGAA